MAKCCDPDVLVKLIEDAALRLLAHIAEALAFFTRLPVPGVLFQDGVRLRAAFWAVPLVGAVIGGILASVLALLLWLGVAEVAAVLGVVGIGFVITGALHEDGLADFCDGLGGSNREDALAIMKDSQIGSFGCLGLGLSVVGRVLMLLELTRLGAGWQAVLVMHVGARGCLSGLLFYPLARGEGAAFSALGARADQIFQATLALVVAGVVFVLAASSALPPLEAMMLLGFGFLVVFAVGMIAMRRFGGVTGDVFGAAEQISEFALLAGLLCFLS